ncbi:MAG: hypothetical protein IPF88_14460 [Candidatus Microthrix sp.]|nr:hypothetical protein [Candidatus Microthrix sp.]MBK6439741.1 hypothetical protein [Candidatus Microthrix sp.]
MGGACQAHARGTERQHRGHHGDHAAEDRHRTGDERKHAQPAHLEGISADAAIAEHRAANSTVDTSQE